MTEENTSAVAVPIYFDDLWFDFFFFRKSLFLFCGCLTDTNFQISTSLMAAQFPAVTVLNRAKKKKKFSTTERLNSGFYCCFVRRLKMYIASF